MVNGPTVFKGLTLKLEIREGPKHLQNLQAVASASKILGCVKKIKNNKRRKHMQTRALFFMEDQHIHILLSGSTCESLVAALSALDEAATACPLWSIPVEF